MKKDNPYTIMFGKKPSQLISRFIQSDEVISSFLSENPSGQIYMITGVRGSGKTVFMTDIANQIQKEKNWIVVELNPAKDLLLGLAAKLYNHKDLTELFNNAKINLSFFGIGIEIERGDKITDIEVALSRMLESIKKHRKRVLITIDEVTNSDSMRIFASAFQIFIRQELPLFLLMTGLYDNIDALQNDKILTFLHRAPKLWLKALNIGSIAEHYRATFALDSDDAGKMAKLTRGYPFAFQVLGYYTYEKGGDYKAALADYRQYLDEYVYDKLWSELSKIDKDVTYAVAYAESEKIIEIREMLKMKSNEFSPYRDRLIKKGIINGDERGYMRFALPFFETYVSEHYVGDLEF